MPQTAPLPQSDPAPQPPQIVLVHIGKCGGSTLRAALESSATKVDIITHGYQPPLGPQYRYYITLRDPISRATSAFYWRRKLVLTEARQPDRFPGEAQILRYYGSLNTLAEALYCADGSPHALAQGHFRAIHHLSEDIGFYLQELLANSQPDQILGVTLQETLAADLLRLFGTTNPERIHDNRQPDPSEDRSLSPQGATNLRRFLRADFDCIKQLSTWGKIPAQAYPWL
ncbi:hypothetical protein [Pseudophaeobacter sp.]|uniref:hypothetical protein n=1 Tax=Pseudophaeobacter sp. TaxID=1971739 RepID=UPI003296A532